MTKAQLRAYCEAEFENIKASVRELQKVHKKDKPSYTVAELAAMATFIHNIYNGWENILKRFISQEKIHIPQGPTWHKDLLQAALQHGILDADLHARLAVYLSFRHFFIHSYSFVLKWEELAPLIRDLSKTLRDFESAINQHT
jgi:uncharacterized protein YutE (UPF0331/DUF86 family)